MHRLKDLRLFIASYEERSFSGAARREHATQSGVSQHIQKLETFLRVPLFQRYAKSIAPTPAGDAYYAHCIEILRLFDFATKDLQRFQGLDGEISVAVTPWVARTVLGPSLLRRFTELYPNVSLRVVEDTDASLKSRVRAGEVTIGLASANEDGSEHRILSESPAVLAWSAHAVVDRKRQSDSIPFSSLKLALPGRASRWRQRVEAYLQNSRFEVRQFLELSSTLAAIKLVTTSDWVTILPEFYVRADNDRDALFSCILPGGPLFRLASHRTSRPLSDAGRAFHQLLESEVIQLSRQCEPLVTSSSALTSTARKKIRKERKPV